MSNVQWNTGRCYSSKGQRIVARQLPDGTVVFRDHDRHVDGILTVESTYGGGASGGPVSFPPLDAVGTRLVVDDRYCNGYRYRSAGRSVAGNLDWEE